MSATPTLWLQATAPLLATQAAGSAWAGGRWHGGGWHGGGWWWLLWWLAMVGISVAFVTAVVWLIRRQSEPGGGWRRARRILAERYARGELSTEEYRERLQELERGDDDC